MITVSLAPYEDDEGNRIEYDGPVTDTIKVTFRGKNNVARIHAKASAPGLKVDFNSSNGTFVLGANPVRRPFSGGVRVGEDATVEIGDNVSSTSGITISAVEGVSVIIGNDVMFASQNQVRADDGHPIFDVRSGERVNRARTIRIGNHVWVGFGAMILGGASIGEGSVIGAGSIVTRKIPNNVVAVGTPARVIRKHVAWERIHLGADAPFYKPDASTVKKSKYWNLTLETGAPERRSQLGFGGAWAANGSASETDGVREHDEGPLMTGSASFLQVTYNSRGLGGLPTADGGGVLASGILYRADALSGLTDGGQQALADHRIGTVIDLRTDAERARAADRLPADGSVRLVSLPVQGGAMDELVQKLMPSTEDVGLSEEQIALVVDQVPTLEDLYVAILDGSATQFAEIGRVVVAASGTDRPGVLFHCTAGKDRTGLAAALLLLVAGAARDVIVADYVQTGTNLAGGPADTLTALITTLGVPLTPRLKTLATESPASAIETALDWIESEHGDVAGYLRTGGLTDAEIDELRRVLRAA